MNVNEEAVSVVQNRAVPMDRAQMEWQWAVEKYDGHRWSRHGGWVGPEAIAESIARLRLRKAREDGETARLVRRLVGPVEVIDGE